MLYSADTDEVINLHLQWSQKYGIDGFGLQRFVCELYDQQRRDWRTSVLERINRLAPVYQRYFYVAYDISGAPEQTFHERITSDWNEINERF